MIRVTRRSGTEERTFDVTLRDGRGETRHAVTVAPDLLATAGAAGASPEACVEAAFLFLLDREPKEAILARFDLSVIARYFPEFEAEFPRYLARAAAGPAQR